MFRGRVLLLAPVVLLAGLAGACSSDKRIPAVGPAYEIVVMAPEGMKVLSDAVAGVLGAEIVTIRHEPRYEITTDVLSEYKYYRTRKMLFAIGPRKDASFEKLLRATTGTRSPTAFPGLYVEWEPFAATQAMFWLTGDPQTILANVRDHADELIDAVERTTVEVIQRSIYLVGEQPNARRHLRDRFGWGVRLPSEWKVEDRSSGETKFVRVWHDAPVEQMFVSWEDGRVERTVDEWIERRHELVWYHYDRDQVVFDRTDGGEGATPFGFDGVSLHGLWENNVYVIGGPFEAWAFYCPGQDRTYLVDLSVYAPDRDKLPLQRVLRAVADTFRADCGPASTRAADDAKDDAS
jgi:Domain of unknown function (DUF4837)